MEQLAISDFKGDIVNVQTLINEENIIPIEVEEAMTKGFDLFELSHDGLRIFIRRPDKATFKMFIDSAAGKMSQADALENFAKQCLVYPHFSEIQKLEKERPAIWTSIASKIQEVIGFVNFSMRQLTNKKSS